MKLLKFIPAAAIALSALIPLKANAENLPNGWSQVGQDCYEDGDTISVVYTKLQKNSDNSLYGVWKTKSNDESWNLKDVSLVDANQRMNNKCDTNSYQPTS